MITKDQIHQYAKTLKTNEVTAFREYLQYIFLSVLYQHKSSGQVYFKGGTAIHIIYKAPRFSEDLDFSTQIEESSFTSLINATFSQLTQSEQLLFKERKTITGKRYMLHTTNLPSIRLSILILTFHFEKLSKSQNHLFFKPHFQSYLQVLSFTNQKKKYLLKKFVLL